MANNATTFTAGGFHWRAHADCQAALFGPDGLRLAEWRASGLAEVVKHGPHCTVYRVRLPGLDCHIKHYRPMNARAWLRELVRPAKAVAEHHRTWSVAARRVPTVEPLAVGRQDRPFFGPGESFLITRTLADTVALGAFLERQLPALPEGRQTVIRQRLAAALGQMLARMHAGGVIHHDLHPGNLLLRLGPQDEPALFLIDLHAVTVGPPLGWAERQASLVMLNRYFMLRASRSDRLRFWRAYARLVVPPDLATPRSLERATLRSNLGFWRQRDQRCLVDNRYYHRIRGPGVVGHAVRDLPTVVVERLLHDPDALFRDPAATMLKSSPSSTVVAVVIDGSTGPIEVIAKRFRVTTWTDPYAALVRRTPALRSWVYGHGLRERCLPTPRPLVVLHRTRNGLSREGYLITEKLPDAVGLDEEVKGWEAVPGPLCRAMLRQRAREIARLVRSLHDRRLSHRDLKAANVLISQSRAWLIDLVGVSRHRRLPRARRVQNLARLHASFLNAPLISRTEKLRFLQAYLRVGLTGRAAWKGWWRRIAEATLRKIRRNQQRGRLLA